MPQYRKLSTRTPESFDFNELCDDFTRLTWVLLPLVSCRDGRGIDIPSWLIGKLFPLRQDVTPAMIEIAMSAFEARGMIVRYAIDGRKYYQIVNWARYQGSTDKEGVSPYPAPVRTNSGVTPELVQSGSRLDADADANTDADADAEGESGAIAPAPSPSAFQPVPETVTRQQRRAGIRQPTPAMTAPAALRFLHELTAYWPGEDNAPLIVASLGDNPDRSTLARAVELWRASGHKINNWLGICDWYHEILRDPGWTPQARFKSRPNGSSPAGPVLSPAEQAAERYVSAKRAVLGGDTP